MDWGACSRPRSMPGNRSLPRSGGERRCCHLPLLVRPETEASTSCWRRVALPERQGGRVVEDSAESHQPRGTRDSSAKRRRVQRDVVPRAYDGSSVRARRRHATSISEEIPKGPQVAGMDVSSTRAPARAPSRESSAGCASRWWASDYRPPRRRLRFFPAVSAQASHAKVADHVHSRVGCPRARACDSLHTRVARVARPRTRLARGSRPGLRRA